MDQRGDWRLAFAAVLIAVLVFGLGSILHLAGLNVAANIAQLVSMVPLVTGLARWAMADREKEEGSRQASLANLGVLLRTMAYVQGLAGQEIHKSFHDWDSNMIDAYLNGALCPEWKFVSGFLDMIAGPESFRRELLERQIRPAWEAATDTLNLAEATDQSPPSSEEVEEEEELESADNNAGVRYYSIVPQPMPSPHPVLKKTWVWIISLTGGANSIALLAAALAPSPGNDYNPAGGVVGSLGLMLSIWVGWYAHRVPLTGMYRVARPFNLTIIPQPLPARHPVLRVLYLWLASLAGSGICLYVLASSLAPSIGNSHRPVGDVLGSLGFLFSLWIGWYASKVGLNAAKHAQLPTLISDSATATIESNMR